MRALLLVLVLALAGCTTEVGGAPVESSSAPSSVDVAVPIEMRPVTADGATVLADPATGESLKLADPIMTIRRLDGAEVTNDNGLWALNLDLNTQDAKTFADWTTAHTGERLAIVIDDEVVVAPTIQSAITGGEVQISGDYTRNDVDKLLARISGR
ncbi:SecDF P1 head subdomain-containing protein [Actinophytocola sp.]|uniref:SecDF P1 head subdomain-containing protein n=1 Tax=Actinophytocola sp. TaxID=1872138 RepID=UPI003899B7AE